MLTHWSGQSRKWLPWRCFQSFWWCQEKWRQKIVRSSIYLDTVLIQLPLSLISSKSNERAILTKGGTANIIYYHIGTMNLFVSFKNVKVGCFSTIKASQPFHIMKFSFIDSWIIPTRFMNARYVKKFQLIF